MENAPNPFNNAPDKKLEISNNQPQSVRNARRKAMAEWYMTRQSWARERYRQWVKRRTYENKAGMIKFDMMGRVAVNSIADTESDPNVRGRRRAYLTRKWQQFMRNAF